MKDLYLYYDVIAHAKVSISDEEYEKFKAMRDDEQYDYVRAHFRHNQVFISEYEFSGGLPYCIDDEDGDEVYYL